jgi:hypothetical protein
METWAFSFPEFQSYVSMFREFDSSKSGILSGKDLRPRLEAFGLPVDQLRKLWSLVDRSKNGSLDLIEFTVLMITLRRLGQRMFPAVPDIIPSIVWTTSTEFCSQYESYERQRMTKPPIHAQPGPVLSEESEAEKTSTMGKEEEEEQDIHSKPKPVDDAPERDWRKVDLASFEDSVRAAAVVEIVDTYQHARAKDASPETEMMDGDERNPVSSSQESTSGGVQFDDMRDDKEKGKKEEEEEPSLKGRRNVSLYDCIHMIHI